MSLTKEITDKKVNFEFNKEFINVFDKKIKDNDTDFLNRALKELDPADSADSSSFAAIGQTALRRTLHLVRISCASRAA